MASFSPPPTQVDGVTLQQAVGILSATSVMCRIARGSYVGTGAAGNNVALPFRPRAILIANAAAGIAGTGWVIDGVDDNERGIVNGLQVTSAACDITATGFTPAGGNFNAAAATYYYVAFGGA